MIRCAREGCKRTAPRPYVNLSSANADATVMSRGTGLRAIAVVIGAALLMMASACSVADRDLVRELRQKGHDEGLGLIRVLNFRSDEITLEPMNRQQRDPFSWWYLMTNVSSPDGSSIIGI